jgi:hypothetical protein
LAFWLHVPTAVSMVGILIVLGIAILASSVAEQPRKA